MLLSSLHICNYVEHIIMPIFLSQQYIKSEIIMHLLNFTNSHQVLMLLAPIIIWSIWATRCTRVFSANKRPPRESIKLIWHTLITTLRARIWADWWNGWCCRTNEAEFKKTVVYYTDGCKNWNGYTMVVHSTKMVVPPLIRWKRGVNVMGYIENGHVGYWM